MPFLKFMDKKQVFYFDNEFIDLGNTNFKSLLIDLSTNCFLEIKKKVLRIVSQNITLNVSAIPRKNSAILYSAKKKKVVI